VDHGTALDLAATGQNDSGSLLAAIEMAITLIENRNLNQ
jgi:4-hydroxythreonine-4-phosphate dehydrogenase